MNFKIKSKFKSFSLSSLQSLGQEDQASEAFILGQQGVIKLYVFASEALIAKETADF